MYVQKEDYREVTRHNRGKQGHKHTALTLWLISESSILFAIADSEACHCCQFFCNPLFKLHYPLTNNEGRQLKSMSFFLSFKPWFICPDIIETHFQICSRDWWSKMPNSNFLRQTLLSVYGGKDNQRTHSIFSSVRQSGLPWPITTVLLT